MGEYMAPSAWGKEMAAGHTETGVAASSTAGDAVTPYGTRQLTRTEGTRDSLLAMRDKNQLQGMSRNL